FAVRFARQRWLPTRWLPLLFLEPLLVFVLACTDGYHGLIRKEMWMDHNGSYAVMIAKYGPLFWVHLVYSYWLFFLGGVLMLVGLRQRPDWPRFRFVVLLAGMAIPTLGNVAYVLRWQPAEWGDLTPTYFAVSGLGAYWMLFRVRVFDILPIARDVVLDCLDDS